MAATGSLAGSAERKSRGSVTPRTRLTIVRAARPAGSCLRTGHSAGCCAKTGRDRSTKWKKGRKKQGSKKVTKRLPSSVFLTFRSCLLSSSHSVQAPCPGPRVCLLRSLITSLFHSFSRLALFSDCGREVQGALGVLDGRGAAVARRHQGVQGVRRLAQALVGFCVTELHVLQVQADSFKNFHERVHLFPQAGEIFGQVLGIFLDLHAAQ